MKALRIVLAGTLGVLAACRLGDLVNEPAGIGLHVLPGRVSDTATAGSTSSHPWDLRIDPSGADSVSWRAARARGGSSWLSLSAIQGTAPAHITAHVDPSGLSPGVYRDTILVWPSDKSSDTVRIPVELSVAPAPSSPPPTATRLTFTTQPSTTETGQPITPAVRVTAVDASGNPVSSYAGTITVALGSGGGSGSLSGTRTVTASNGVATFADLHIDQAGTGYTLTAAASGLSGATSASFDVTAPPPPPPVATRLTFTTQPSTTETGQPITPAVRVTALDASGNPVSSYAGTITVALGSGGGGSSLSGTRTVTASNGVATFADLRIDQAGTGYTLTAAASGLSGATSAAFDVTAPPPPPPPPVATQLLFTTQPATTVAGTPISPAVQVTALDDAGNIVTTFTGSITIGLAANLEGAVLYGTVTVNAVNGVATFSNLRVDRAGVDYRLTAAFTGGAPLTTSALFIIL